MSLSSASSLLHPPNISFRHIILHNLHTLSLSHRVAELKAALTERGLDTTGLKADLQVRLQEALDDEEFGGGGAEEPAKEAPAAEEPVVEEPIAEEPVAEEKADDVVVGDVAADAEKVEEKVEEEEEVRRIEKNHLIPFIARALTQVNTQSAPEEVSEEQKKLDEHEAKKKARAERFGIPYVAPKPKPQQKNNNKNKNKKRKNEGGNGNGNNNGNNNNNNNNNNKKNKKPKQEKPRRSKEDLQAEIAMREKREKRFGQTDKGLDALKAELRRYTFGT